MLADDDELSPFRDPFLKNLLEEERRRVVGGVDEHKEELRFFIRIRESVFADDNKLTELFESYLLSLADAERPRTRPQEHRLYNKWEGNLRQELAGWKDELAELEAQTRGHAAGLRQCQGATDTAVEAEVREAGLLPSKPTWKLLLSPFLVPCHSTLRKGCRSTGSFPN